MKRYGKLVILLLVLVALILAYFIYNSYMKKSETDDVTAEETVLSVLNLSSSKISSIKYLFDEKEVLLVKKEDGWKWADDEEFPIDTSYPETMANALSNITALRLITESSDKFGEYGLDDPCFEVAFETVDGNQYTYTIGDYNSVTDGYYFKLDNSDKVYLSDATIKTPFEYAILDMVEKEEFPVIQYESITSLEYTSQGKKHTVTTDSNGADFYTDPYMYFLIDENGEVAPADGRLAAELLISTADVTFSDCIVYKPDQETLEMYGLSDEKRSVFDIIYTETIKNDTSGSNVTVSTEKSYSFSVGCYVNEITGKNAYCAMTEGSDVIYSISENTGEALFNSIKADLASKYVCPVLSENIISFSVEYQQKRYYSSAADFEKNEEVSDLFTKITALVSEGIGDKPKGELYLKAIFHTGEKEIELNIYKYDDEYYIATFDKWDNMLVSAEKINAVI